MQETNTLETDAVFQAHLSLPQGTNVVIPKGHPPCDPWELARKLERENADLRKQLAIANKKNEGSLANNLCPDHRDKQAGKSCLACTIERLEKQLAEDRGPEGLIPVGWIQEHKHGKSFFEGDLDPREVHDNGRPCYRVYRLAVPTKSE